MKKINPAYTERLFHIINTSAFPNHMKMQIKQIAIDGCTFELEPAQFRMQPFGSVHGGNLATVIDSATFWACYFSMENDDDGLTSIDLKLNYLAPAFSGLITCQGKLIKSGKTISYAEATAVDNKGNILAHGTSTLIRLAGKGLKTGIPMFT
jgi:uncharacterized protein (TIGR00369 family)